MNDLANTEPSSLQITARQLLADDKGILAMDESIVTCNQRFARLGIAQTYYWRSAWRELLVNTPDLSNCIGSVIMTDETLRQHTSDGPLLLDLLAAKHIIPGVKVDKGARDLAGHPGETLTEGLDGLRKRLAEYAALGARFTKWRAVVRIADQVPTRACIQANTQVLALFAALSQEAGLVPIVEPEVLMDGDHSLDRCQVVTTEVLHSLFYHLHEQRVLLDGLVLKSNMVVPGLSCRLPASIEEVAAATISCLRQVVPSAVAGVAFLSGGQTPELASARLNAMCQQTGQRLPWPLTFSFSRALQQPALDIWRGNQTQTLAAQQAFYHRALCNCAARRGQYTAAMEMAATL